MEELNITLEDLDLCEHCGGTGEVNFDVQNKDGHWERGVGSRTCDCRLVESDFSGATEGDR